MRRILSRLEQLIVTTFIVFVMMSLKLNAAPYDHQSGAFPLDGQHQTLECQDCHQNGVFKGKLYFNLI